VDNTLVLFLFGTKRFGEVGVFTDSIFSNAKAPTLFENHLALIN
jgi:hypothetical protein